MTCCTSPCVQVETQRDRSLPRRIQSLQRFLLEQLHKEASQQLGIASTTASPSPTLPLAPSSAPAAPGSAPSPPGAGLQAGPQAVAVTLTATGSGVVVALAAPELEAAAGLSPEVAGTPQSAGRGVLGSVLSPAGESPELAHRQQQQAGVARTVVDQTFGLLMQQHTQCLTGSRPVKDRQVKSFQVGLALAGCSGCGSAQCVTSCTAPDAMCWLLHCGCVAASLPAPAHNLLPTLLCNRLPGRVGIVLQCSTRKRPWLIPAFEG